MINGSEHPTEYWEQYIKRVEFAPLVKKVEELTVAQAVFQETMTGMAADISAMRADNKEHLTVIQADMHKLVVHDALRVWLIKAGVWIFGGLSSIVVPMVAGHLTGFWKFLGHLFS